MNRILEEQKKTAIRPGKSPKHLFSGLLHCQCGRRMYVLSNTPKYFCERCSTRIPCVDLEAIFLDQLKGYFADSDRIGGYVREATEKSRANIDLLGAIAGEISKVKEQMTKTHQLYLAGAASVERFKELNDPLELSLIHI